MFKDSGCHIQTTRNSDDADDDDDDRSSKFRVGAWGRQVEEWGNGERQPTLLPGSEGKPARTLSEGTVSQCVLSTLLQL